MTVCELFQQDYAQTLTLLQGVGTFLVHMFYIYRIYMG